MTDTPKTLEEMTPEEAAPIMEAWRTGQTLGFFHKKNHIWYEKTYKPCIWTDTAYRVPVTQDDIPWDILPDEIQWTARDKNGEIWGFPAEPYLDGNHWHGADCVNLSGAIKIKEGTCDWKDSLQQRPGANT